MIRFRVEARFADVGVAYVEAASQAEAEAKANELNGGEFLISDRDPHGEIISVVELEAVEEEEANS